MDPLTLLLSQSVVTGTLSSLRPALVVAILQLYLYIMGLMQGSPMPMPEGMEWMTHEITIAVVIGWAVAEHFIWSDPSFEDVEAVKYLKIVVGTMFAAMGPVLLGAARLDPASWQQANETVAVLIHSAGPTEAFFSAVGLSMLTAAISATVTGVLRSWVLTTLDAIDAPTSWIRWAESASTVALLLVILLVPVLAVVVASLLVIVVLAAMGATLAARNAWERRQRIPCPSCGHLVRKEALICPECHHELDPSHRLDAVD
ncbi:MAG: zinc ribbon domain-containing protein [Myxococcota bacterium]